MRIKIDKEFVEVPWLNRHEMFKAMIKRGRLSLIIQEIQRRLYSDRLFLILYKTFDHPPPIPQPKIKLNLRSLQLKDISVIFDLHNNQLDVNGVRERLRLIPLLTADLECSVVETEEGEPCHLFWLITSKENAELKKLFGGRILPLREEEYLVEGAFTLEKYQRMGILTWRRLALYHTCYQMGKRKVINYIRSDNLPSLLSCKNVGYKLFMIRKDKWRFFHNSFVFEKVPEDTPYPF